MSRRSLWGVLALSAVLTLYPATSAMAAGDGEWEVVRSPNVGTSTNALADVAAISSDDVWAVGLFFDPNRQINRTLIEHWDGTRWRVTPHPTAGTGYHSFWAVDAVDADDVWAVGSFIRRRFDTEQSLIMQWNGVSWASMTAPAQPGWDAIYDVSAVAENDAWAVGNAYTGSFILRWDGTTWSEVPSPNLGFILAVDAVSADDVWVVGQQTLPSDRANGPIYGTLTVHWDGSEWTEIPSPNSDEDFTDLYSVHGISSDDVWAVGASWDSTRPFHTWIQHWDGSTWSVVPGAQVSPDSELFGVHMVSGTEVWAVGQSDGATLIERWDGSAWQVVASPSPGQDDALADVSGLASGEVWAVGSAATGPIPRTLTLRNLGSL